VLRDAIKGHEVRFQTAGSVWKFGTRSSGLRSTLAALKHYGLLEYIGSGTDQKIKLTDLANRIFLDVRPQSPDRDDLTKKAALMPKLHKQLWEKWGADVPADVEMQAELTLELGFSQNGAHEAISVYKQSLRFAGLPGSDKMPEGEADKSDDAGSQGSQEPVKVTAPHQQRSLPLEQRPVPLGGAVEERINYKPGQDVLVRFTTEPDIEMYELVRDYMDFRIERLKKQMKPNPE
jgi:hypothetical protein